MNKNKIYKDIKYSLYFLASWMFNLILLFLFMFGLSFSENATTSILYMYIPAGFLIVLSIISFVLLSFIYYSKKGEISNELVKSYLTVMVMLFLTIISLNLIREFMVVDNNTFLVENNLTFYANLFLSISLLLFGLLLVYVSKNYENSIKCLYNTLLEDSTVGVDNITNADSNAEVDSGRC